MNKIKKKSEINETEPITSKTEMSAFEYAKKAENEPDLEKRKTIYLEALDKYPKIDWLWNDYTYFLYSVKKDYEQIEEYHLKTLNAEPEVANYNGNYANFLTHMKKDYFKAEKYYLKALSIEPNDANINGNYAGFLLINGRKKEATNYLEKAFILNKNEKIPLLIELWFYKYAHYFETEMGYEKEIELLLNKGIRTIDSFLDMSVAVAIKNGHPNPYKLIEFLERITKE